MSVASNTSSLISSVYLDMVRQGRITQDAAQMKAVKALDGLAEQLATGEVENNRKGIFRKLLGGGHETHGVYMWGGVGRGKSFVMDLFYKLAPTERKLRIHFHEFMRQTQREINRLTGQENPFEIYAAELAARYDLICFDEFHVSDAVESLFMGRIFDSLLKTHLRFCLTSNFIPEELYPAGKNRKYLEVAIETLKQKLTVLRVDSDTDYRQSQFAEDSKYYAPHDEKAVEAFERFFEQHGGQDSSSSALTINKRPFKAIRAAERAVWFDFVELCEEARSTQDFLAMATQYPVVLVQNVPQLKPKMFEAARRFTWLIDILYDNQNVLLISAANMPDELYPDGFRSGEFQRTASRLTEMQTAEYVEKALNKRLA